MKIEDTGHCLRTALDCHQLFAFEDIFRSLRELQSCLAWKFFNIQSNSGGNKMIINQVGSRAQGNVPIYWHKGHYTSHTGGWPCDTVTLAEYDDLGLRGIPGGFAP